MHKVRYCFHGLGYYMLVILWNSADFCQRAQLITYLGIYRMTP